MITTQSIINYLSHLIDAIQNTLNCNSCCMKNENTIEITCSPNNSENTTFTFAKRDSKDSYKSLEYLKQNCFADSLLITGEIPEDIHI